MNMGLSEMEIKNYVVLYDEYLIAQVLEYWISSLLQTSHGTILEIGLSSLLPRNITFHTPP